MEDSGGGALALPCRLSGDGNWWGRNPGGGSLSCIPSRPPMPKRPCASAEPPGGSNGNLEIAAAVAAADTGNGNVEPASEDATEVGQLAPAPVDEEPEQPDSAEDAEHDDEDE